MATQVRDEPLWIADYLIVRARGRLNWSSSTALISQRHRRWKVKWNKGMGTYIPSSFEVDLTCLALLLANYQHHQYTHHEHGSHHRRH
jgi:hypothetical protein